MSICIDYLSFPLQQADLQVYRYMLEEISQLCLLVHQYEQHVQPYKQTLFNDHCITDESIWQCMLKSTKVTDGISAQILYAFITKNIGELDPHNKNKISATLKDCQRVCERYSQERDQIIRRKQLWGIFRPLHMAHTDTILKCRKSRGRLSECPQFHYKTRDSMISILLELIDFQRSAQRMRENIQKHIDDQTGFQLKTIDAEHLQAYLCDYTAELTVSECKVIMQHILNYKLDNKTKKFYTFFLPNYTHKPQKTRTNPNKQFIIDKIVKGKYWQEEDNERPRQPQRLTQLKHFHQGTKNWNYGHHFTRNKKPLYLQ